MQKAVFFLIIAFVLTGCPAASALTGLAQGMVRGRIIKSSLAREQAEADYLKGIVEIEKQRLELERERLELEKDRTKSIAPPIDPFPASRMLEPPLRTL